jgi:NAD+ kinase
LSFPYRTVGLVAKTTYGGIDDIIWRIEEWMRARNIRVFALEKTTSLPDEAIVSRDVFEKQCDLLLVLGGDGTFLAAARLTLSRNIPILGVNLGRLGFLTEISLDELFPVLERIEFGEMNFEKRHLLQARIKQGDEILFEGHVINDAVVAKANIARLLEIETRVNANYLALFKADGLIISTPTGSTAYSLAAGGPIVFPTMEATIMTPICAHSLNQRPLVIPEEMVISVHVQTPAENVNLTLDGQIVRALRDGEYVEIAKSMFQLNVMKSPFKNYFDILKSKLRWAEG